MLRRPNQRCPQVSTNTTTQLVGVNLQRHQELYTKLKYVISINNKQIQEKWSL